jgi:tetratricopeptide (TPR) repeat protein
VITLESSKAAHPTCIGPYRILEVLGEGGMGVVYSAEETGPVRRRVALKVMRAVWDMSDVIARFEAERQALAVMNHPAIACMLHAGATENGQPYFAMEYVSGLPITAFCDARCLPLRERIELFIAVCQGVQHAHQKGIIHRDLKPSNILITEQDGVPQPKIIDFGIAKALSGQLTDRTSVTLRGQTMGTAAYMSPEQAGESTGDVDTRADIYSLGVVLYELLVGRLPLDPVGVSVLTFLATLAAGMATPPSPSAGFVSLGNARVTAARMRRTDPETLCRDLKGDLDCIVMKALEPVRARRYETANGFANDLLRHLAHEPVAARPPTARYRLAKFVRRNRAVVAAVMLVVIGLLGGAVVATAGFVRATRAERHAAAEAAAAGQVTDFLVRLFQASDPGVARGDPLLARGLLDAGRKRVMVELAGQPVLRARIMHTLGTVYAELFLFDDAELLLDSALNLRENQLGQEDPSVAETLRELGTVARNRGQNSRADDYYQRALRIQRNVLGSEHVEAATTLALIAALRVREDRLDQAESLYAEVVAIDARLRGPADARLLRSLRGLAAVPYRRGNLAEAESLWTLVLARQEKALGPDHYDVAGTLVNLGAAAYGRGAYREALVLYERASAIYDRSLPPGHSRIAGVLNNLGETYWKMGELPEAESRLRHALVIKQKILAPADRSIGITLHALAGVLRDQRRYGEAEPLYLRVLAIRQVTPGPSGRDLKETLQDYALLLEARGRRGEAEALRRQAGEAK